MQTLRALWSKTHQWLRLLHGKWQVWSKNPHLITTLLSFNTVYLQRLGWWSNWSPLPKASGSFNPWQPDNGQSFCANPDPFKGAISAPLEMWKFILLFRLGVLSHLLICQIILISTWMFSFQPDWFQLTYSLTYSSVQRILSSHSVPGPYWTVSIERWTRPALSLEELTS